MTCSVGVLSLVVGLVKFMHTLEVFLMALGVFIVAFSVFYWWRDVIRERCFMGLHNSVVKRAHYVAIMLFIASIDLAI